LCVCTCVHMCLCALVCALECACVPVCSCGHVCMFACACVRVCARECAHTCVRVLVHVGVCMCACVPVGVCLCACAPPECAGCATCSSLLNAHEHPPGASVKEHVRVCIIPSHRTSPPSPHPTRRGPSCVCGSYGGLQYRDVPLIGRPLVQETGAYPRRCPLPFHPPRSQMLLCRVGFCFLRQTPCYSLLACCGRVWQVHLIFVTQSHTPHAPATTTTPHHALPQVYSAFSYGMHVLPKMMMQDDLHSVDALVGMRPDVMTPT
jgi:hypothetical protein